MTHGAKVCGEPTTNRRHRLTRIVSIFVLPTLLVQLALACGATTHSNKEALMVADVLLLALRKGAWKSAYSHLDALMKRECGGEANEFARRAIDRFEARIIDWDLRVQKTYPGSVHLVGEVERDGMEPVSIGVIAEPNAEPEAGPDGERWRISIFEVDGEDLCGSSS